MSDLKTIPQIIDALGAAPLAKAFGHRHVSTVTSWKARRSIPVEHWTMVIAYARKRGVALDFAVLAKACTTGKRQS